MLLTDLAARVSHYHIKSRVSLNELQRINKCKWQQLVLMFEAKSGRPIPLQHTATGGGWGGYVSIRGTIALIEVRTANIVNWGRREVLWWIFWPAKLLLGFTVDLYWIKHGDASWVNRRSNFKMNRKMRMHLRMVSKKSAANSMWSMLKELPLFLSATHQVETPTPHFVTNKQINILLPLFWRNSRMFQIELQKMLRYFIETKFHLIIKMYFKGLNWFVLTLKNPSVDRLDGQAKNIHVLHKILKFSLVCFIVTSLHQNLLLPERKKCPLINNKRDNIIATDSSLLLLKMDSFLSACRASSLVKGKSNQRALVRFICMVRPKTST